MSSLAALQGRFARYILDGDADALAADLVAGARGNLVRRMAVYRDGYRLRLLEALRTTYPALHEFLGDEQFDALCTDYLRARPSAHPSLRWYGHDLGAFLAGHTVAGAHPVLAELAAFEWALSLVFDAADAPALVFADLARIPGEDWPGLRFRLHPALQVLEMHTNAALIRRARDEGEAPPEPAALEQPVSWLLWRQDLVCRFRSLAHDEAAMLRAAQAGADFTGLCTALEPFNAADAVPLRAATLLRGWVDEGLVGGTASG